MKLVLRAAGGLAAPTSVSRVTHAARPNEAATPFSRNRGLCAQNCQVPTNYLNGRNDIAPNKTPLTTPHTRTKIHKSFKITNYRSPIRVCSKNKTNSETDSKICSIWVNKKTKWNTIYSRCKKAVQKFDISRRFRYFVFCEYILSPRAVTPRLHWRLSCIAKMKQNIR